LFARHPPIHPFTNTTRQDLTRGLDRRMDRWEVCMTEAVPSLERHKQPVKYMLGYLGIGVDGKVGG